MEQVIWVEILARSRQVLARQRFAADQVRIGRSYANDLVLDDPAVAPFHLVIAHREDGVLVATNLADNAGLFADGGRRPVESIDIDPDMPFRIGQTLLRVRTPAYDVAASHAGAPARPPSPLGRVAWPVVAAIVAVGTSLAAVWVQSVTEPRVTPLLSAGLGVLLLALIWAGIWSLISRAVSGRWRFDRNFEIGAAMIFAYVVIFAAIPILAYAFSWQTGSSASAAVWVLIGLAVFAHLRSIGPSRPLLKASIVGVLILAIVAIDVLNRAENRSISGGHSATDLMPPSFKLTAPHDSAAFFDALGGVKSALERAKRRPAGQGIIF